MDQGGTPAESSAGRAADDAVSADDADITAVTMTGRRFAAFISYAHVDEAVAAKLHKQIETYRLPKKLRAADGGEADVRLGTVFRDRADLAAADSLNAAIRAALADSGALIVLCSSAAVQSRWVNEEIRLFRVLNPGAPVLAAIVHGEPAEAMPAALTEDGREPLAADLREEGDGRKLGFLKIVAALAGVPLDALIQRDAQRKLRRVMAVTVGAVIALVGTVTMMTYAIQQRNEAQAQREEAERRRAQAEGLVDFMLTDLRERLRGVGRLDIMRLAVSSALDSYGRDGERGELSPDGQGQLARLLHAVAEDDLRSYRIAEAMQSLRLAQSITAALLADAPRDPDRLFNHAQSAYWLGYLHYRRGQYERARTYWQSYRRLAERLRAVDPDGLRALSEIGYAEGNLCTVAVAQRRSATASCSAALRAVQAVARATANNPSAYLDVADRFGWLADAVERERGSDAAIPYRLRQLAIVRNVANRDDDNWDHREYLVNALYATGSAFVRANRRAEANQTMREASTMIAQMQQHDPGNERWGELATQITQAQAELRREQNVLTNP